MVPPHAGLCRQGLMLQNGVTALFSQCLYSTGYAFQGMTGNFCRNLCRNKCFCKINKHKRRVQQQAVLVWMCETSTKASSGRSQRRKKVDAAKIQTQYWRKASGRQRQGINDCYDKQNVIIRLIGPKLWITTQNTQNIKMGKPKIKLWVVMWGGLWSSMCMLSILNSTILNFLRLVHWERTARS